MGLHIIDFMRRKLAFYKRFMRMNSINTILLVTFAYSIQSGYSFPQSNDVKLETADCKCQLYSTCAWSKQLINQITVLEKTDPKRRTYSQQFRSLCNTAHRDV